MLGRARKPHTDGTVELRVRVRADKADAACSALAEYIVEETSIPWREAMGLEDDEIPGVALRGARYKEDLTQVELAKLLGISQHHISEMEHGKRPISKEMAKRLGKVLNIGYKVFL
jgi:DNA-binding XRE family transcriptional regulator